MYKVERSRTSFMTLNGGKGRKFPLLTITDLEDLKIRRYKRATIMTNYFSIYLPVHSELCITKSRGGKSLKNTL